MLNITRDSGYADKLRSYKVILDGEIVGSIGDGQTKNFDLKAGSHTLFLKIDWARSNKMQFIFTEDETVTFGCSSSIRGKRLLLAIVYATIFSFKYISLKRIS